MNRGVVRAGLALTVVCCCCASAAAAKAASLKVKVSPQTIHKGGNYEITVSGNYRKSELTGKAYLISLIQFSGSPCQATAQLENSPSLNLTLQFYFQPNPNSLRVGIFPKPTFTRTDGFKAKSRSTRRVCAYLYSQTIGPSDTTLPIATASVKYRVLR